MLTRRTPLIQNHIRVCNTIIVRSFYKKIIKDNKKYPIISPIEPKLPSVDGSEIFSLWKNKQVKKLDATGWKTKALSGDQTKIPEQYEAYLKTKEKYLGDENKNLPSGYPVYNTENNEVSESWKFYPHTKKEFFESIQKTQLPIRNYPLPLRYGDVVKLSFKSTDSTEPDLFGVVTNIKSASVDSSLTLKTKYGDVESKVNVPVYTTDLSSVEIIDRKNDGSLEEINMDSLPDFIELSQQFKKFELKRRFERMRAYEQKMQQQKKD
ncbi:hypothetical protein ACO0R3_000604 [Hanseniaspora guilliermondii]